MAPTNHLPSSQRTAALRGVVEGTEVLTICSEPSTTLTWSWCSVKSTNMELPSEECATRSETSTEGPFVRWPAAFRSTAYWALFAHVPQVPENRGESPSGSPCCQASFTESKKNFTNATAPSGVCAIASAGIDTEALGLGLPESDGEAVGLLTVGVGVGLG